MEIEYLRNVEYGEDEGDKVPSIITYSIQNMTEKELFVTLDIENPLYVSEEFQDYIRVNFIGSHLFRASSDNITLDANFTLNRIKIPE